MCVGLGWIGPGFAYREHFVPELNFSLLVFSFGVAVRESSGLEDPVQCMRKCRKMHVNKR